MAEALPDHPSGGLLAEWGHSVVILNDALPQSRGLAESIPPSTRKLLAAVGVLDAVERADFFRTRGNTVWWASSEPRVESFGDDASALGYQVFRPQFDTVLLQGAVEAGAGVPGRARVQSVVIHRRRSRTVVYDEGGHRFDESLPHGDLDCSGRAGVVGRRFRVPQPGFRTCALVGTWNAERRLGSPGRDAHGGRDISATAGLVGADLDEHGTSAHGRHAVAADDGNRARWPGVPDRNREATQLNRRLEQRIAGARVGVRRVALFGRRYAGSRFMLVGDAGSFIDPLSSFGVKKALASAWLGAIVAHTRLTHPERRADGLRILLRLGARHLRDTSRRSRDFARAACARPSRPPSGRRAPSSVDARRTPTTVECTAIRTCSARSIAFKAGLGIRSDVGRRTSASSRVRSIRGREIVLEEGA